LTHIQRVLKIPPIRLQEVQKDHKVNNGFYLSYFESQLERFLSFTFPYMKSKHTPFGMHLFINYNVCLFEDLKKKVDFMYRFF
jgi:hypothetical protein